MNFDKKALSDLLKLGDAELCEVLKSLAAEAGADASALKITSSDAARIRTVLSLASDEEVAGFIEKFGGGQKK